MLIIGAKGMASELLNVLINDKTILQKNIIFFDNINDYKNDLIFERYSILKSFDEVKTYFALHKNYNFTLGLGNPYRRKSLAIKLQDMGGKLCSIISSKASIGDVGISIGEGAQIMQGAVITANVQIGRGLLLNLNSTISHDCILGDFVEIACGVNIAGNCKIGNNVVLGTNSTLIPGITIGDNSIIGAGAVVISDVPANVVVAGIPAKVLRDL